MSPGHGRCSFETLEKRILRQDACKQALRTACSHRQPRQYQPNLVRVRSSVLRLLPMGLLLFLRCGLNDPEPDRMKNVMHNEDVTAFSFHERTPVRRPRRTSVPWQSGKRIERSNCGHLKRIVKANAARPMQMLLGSTLY